MRTFINRFRSDRGGTSLYFIAIVPAFIIALGIIVDGQGMFSARADAQSIAEQAARAAGQSIDVSTTAKGNAPPASLNEAVGVARTVISANKVDGTVKLQQGRIVINVDVKRKTRIIGFIGLDTISGHGTAYARIARGIGGDER